LTKPLNNPFFIGAHHMMIIKRGLLLWLLLAPTSSLLAAANNAGNALPPHDDPSHREVRSAIQQIMTEPGKIYEELREIIFKLGAAFERFWNMVRGWKGQPAAPAHSNAGNNNNQDENKNHDEHPSAAATSVASPDKISDNPLNDIHGHLKELHAFSDERLNDVNKTLTASQQRNLEVVRHYSHQALLLDTVAGAMGIALLYTIHNNDWEAIFSLARGRFIPLVGLIPTAMSALGVVKTIVSPIIGPLSALAVSAFVWHKVKGSIQAPLILKHKEEMNKVQATVKEYQKDNRAATEKIIENFNKKLCETQEKFKEERLAELESNKELMQSNMAALKNADMMIQANMSKHEAELDKKFEAERKLLKDKIDKLNTEIDGISSEIAPLKQAVGEEKDVLHQLQPKVAASALLMKQLVEVSGQQLAAIRQLGGQAQPTSKPTIKITHKKPTPFSRTLVGADPIGHATIHASAAAH
jgi:hypothetical protein